MTCEQARQEMIAYLKDELTSHFRRRLKDHLASCPDCRDELGEARRVLEWTESASDAETIRVVHEIINEGIRAKASDIHFEAERSGEMRVRYRVDGVLRDARRIDSNMRPGVLARLKMMAGMNVAQSRHPLTGRIEVKADAKGYDLRVSVTPFITGEGVVIRILDRSDPLIGLDNLGISEENVARLREVIRKPNGLVLVAGPTGSGKTTVLYSLLREAQSDAVNVMSVEDPVEFLLPGVSQAQANVREGLTMPELLRAFMRNDPDVIFCGELRDGETAALLCEAALTGHLAMTVIHAGSAVEALRRLRSFGLGDYLLAAVLANVTCQRLVRKVCQDCKAPAEISESDPPAGFLGITAADIAGGTIVRGAGCESCSNTGYLRRTAIFEVLEVDRPLRALIGNGADLDEIERQALSSGFEPMRQDARRLVLEGLTTPEEAMRVLV